VVGTTQPERGVDGTGFGVFGIMEIDCREIPLGDFCLGVVVDLQVFQI
jgi:hypothetical protein